MPDDLVLAEIAGRVVVAEVLDRETEAAYGRGLRELLRVRVPHTGTYRVPETDATPV